MWLKRCAALAGCNSDTVITFCIELDIKAEESSVCALSVV